MKTAEEWSKAWRVKMDDLGYEGFLSSEFVRKIQVDALRHAAELSANFCSPYLCKLFREQADKLETK